MKKLSLTSIIVFILLTINLFLVYLLLFDTNLLNRWLNQFEGETVITTSTSEPIEDVEDYYEVTTLTLDQLITPTKLIINESSDMYDVNNYATLQSVLELLGSQTIELNTNSVETHPDMYEAVTSGEYLQLLYPTSFSVPSLRGLIATPAELSTQFEMSRLVFPRHLEGTVYLVDTKSQAYMEAELTDPTIAKEIFAVVDAVRDDQWLPVTRFEVEGGAVYLPTYETISLSQIYTLEKLPDSLFLDDIFPSNNYDIAEPDANSVRSYHTLLTTFQINDLTNIMSINHSISSTTGSNNIIRDMVLPEEKVRYSYPYVQTYEYWPSDIRLYSENNNTITYRRFLNGLPIYSAPGLADYGATRVTLRTNPNIEVSRYQMPLITIGTHIHDMSRVYDIESGAQIAALLTEQGLSFEHFTNIVLGYEWQSEMENFKTATLVPKWFFHVNNTYYSIDQVRDGTVTNLIVQNSGQTQATDVSENSISQASVQTETENAQLSENLNIVAVVDAGVLEGLSVGAFKHQNYRSRTTQWESLVQVEVELEQASRFKLGGWSNGL